MSVITDVRISSLWLLFWLLSGAVWASGLRFEDAEPIPLFDNPFSIDKQESDYYLKFELFEGEGVTVALTAHVNSGSMSFYAYQPDDQNNSFASATYIGNGETKTASFTAKVGGTYWVKVTGSVGTADVAVYRAFFNAGVTDASRSFYSTFNTARYLVAGEYARSSLQDFYRFEAVQGDTIVLALTANVNSGSISFYVYQPGDRNSSFASATYLGNNEKKAVSFTAETTGTYFLQVSGASGWYEIETDGVRVDVDEDGDGFFNTEEYMRGSRVDLADTKERRWGQVLQSRISECCIASPASRLRPGMLHCKT